jgi:hypothetical protein
MKTLWYRFLAWTFRKRREAYVRVYLVGTFSGPIRRIEHFRDMVVVLTDRDVYTVRQDYSSDFTDFRRVA